MNNTPMQSHSSNNNSHFFIMLSQKIMYLQFCRTKVTYIMLATNVFDGVERFTLRYDCCPGHQ